MTRRSRRRPASWGYADDDAYSYRRRRRRGGCLAPIQRFLRNVALVLITAIGAIVFFLLVLLIAFNFAAFVQILYYAFFLAVGLAALGVVYLIIRIITAISHRLSGASVAKSKARFERERARIERERVSQARNQVHLQQVKLAREEDAFYQKQEDPRHTRRRRDDEEYPYPERSRRPPESPYRTRHLPENHQEPLVRVLPALSQPPQQVLPGPPKVPHVTRLLGTHLVAGQQDMLYGFEHDQGHLIAIRGDWPGTAIVAGKSGSGKTRRVIVMIFQALLAGQHITVCDPHAYKPDGLIKVLTPFGPWLRFARTEAEIIAAANEHITEFESRLSPSGSMNGEGLLPRLIVFDEFPALMKSDTLRKEDKRALTKCVRESATQYRGVFGSAWIVGQEFTEDAIGDTAIRKDAHAILCHQLSDEYVTFLFPRDLKTQRMVQQIERRECVFKDNDNRTKRIRTIGVHDEEIATMVAYLERVLPPPPPMRTTTVHQRQAKPLPPRVYGVSALRNVPSPILRRTHLVEDHQTTPSPPRVPPSLPVAPMSAGAIWGEEIPVHPPSPSPAPPPTTEELVKDRPHPGTPQRQDTFEMLALHRKKKKK